MWSGTHILPADFAVGPGGGLHEYQCGLPAPAACAASAQPAFKQTGQGISISVVSVAEPGNQKVEAGSATADALSDMSDGAQGVSRPQRGGGIRSKRWRE